MSRLLVFTDLETRTTNKTLENVFFLLTFQNSGSPMEIRRDMNELLSWSKQDEDPFENTEQADGGCGTNDFSGVHGKGEVSRRARRDGDVLKTSVVLIHRFRPHFRTRFCWD